MSTDIHFYEPTKGHQLKHNPFKAIIAPRPIGWISTRSTEGKNNLAPYSFFNAFSDTPPIVGFVSCGWKDSVENVQKTGVFGWNLTTRTLAEQMNMSSKSVAADIDEFELSGLTAKESKLINAPIVAESPVSFECKLTQLIRLTNAKSQEIDNWLVMGEVIGVHINHDYLVDGVYQTTLAQPVMRAGGLGTYYGINDEDKFELIRPQ
ncbi:flavin reductase family protein [Vibrio viridaestus]|uniref:Flavin reductase family protein n=1 Tax=Vibrio viridaestus TaxID=2487322 RepID=A0A3N9THJ7_9VIBR|nr:flavin reductase family protein [Vibrio viridaestus]RQW63737.1 flavin reductase family protein [Vibrio viridaestus]